MFRSPTQYVCVCVILQSHTSSYACESPYIVQASEEGGKERMLTSHPELIYLKFENAKWQIHKDLERGVYPMKVTNKVWIVHEGTKISARRRGWQIVPDFGQTAHSMQGESLVSVIVDCLEVDHCSKSTDMLAAYIGLSRVKTKEALLIAQPFSPALFCNGEPPGPEILLRVVDRKIRANDAQQDRY